MAKTRKIVKRNFMDREKNKKVLGSPVQVKVGEKTTTFVGKRGKKLSIDTKEFGKRSTTPKLKKVLKSYFGR